MFVVVNFDALPQASDFRIERRQVVFLCWKQDSNQGLWNWISGRLDARCQTDWAIEDQAKKFELDSPSLRSATIQSTRPTAGCLSHMALVIYMLVFVNCDALAQGSDFRIERRQVVGSLELNLQQTEYPLTLNNHLSNVLMYYVWEYYM